MTLFNLAYYFKSIHINTHKR